MRIFPAINDVMIFCLLLKILFSGQAAQIDLPRYTIKKIYMKIKHTTVLLMIILFSGLMNLQFLCEKEKNEDPACDIVSPLNGAQINKGETVTITAEAVDGDGTITKLELFIDNALVENFAATPYSFDWNTAGEDPGDYQIKAIATDDGDATATSEISVTIIVPALPPVAQFEATPLIGPEPLDVNFTDLSENDPQSWQWDFGDGLTSAEQNPSHTYND
ncbi:MAG: PKD domain-containing protein, partial [Bacteroidales bacterium]|nr:PKD domain-containing protein [Bacteroidales bacterium]